MQIKPAPFGVNKTQRVRAIKYKTLPIHRAALEAGDFLAILVKAALNAKHESVKLAAMYKLNADNIKQLDIPPELLEWIVLAAPNMDARLTAVSRIDSQYILAGIVLETERLENKIFYAAFNKISDDAALSLIIEQAVKESTKAAAANKKMKI